MSVTSFQLFVLAPIVIACAAYVLWPILRGNRRIAPRDGAGRNGGGDAGGNANRSAPADDTAHALNLQIVRERRAQLDAEIAGLAPGSPEREQRILEFTVAAKSDLDIDAGARANANARANAASAANNDLPPGLKDGSSPGSRSRTMVAVLVGLVLLAGPLIMYRLSGTPEWIEVAANLPQGARGDVDGLVIELERRLQAQPDRADGWLLLGRTRLAMGEIDAARKAMEKALAIDSDDPALAASIRTDLADLIAQAAGTRLDGQPWELIQQALQRDPRHPKALALAGAYQVTRGNAEAALGYWKPLLSILPEGSEQAGQIQSMIDDLQAGRLADGSRAGPAGAPSAASDVVLSGSVVLDPTLAASVAPGDTLFIAARALGPDGLPAGPPVAVRRARVADLPLEFRLSDADAMSPAARLSQQSRVAIVARISRSGAAAPAPGDLEGGSAAVAANASDVEVRIDRVVR